MEIKMEDQNTYTVLSPTGDYITRRLPTKKHVMSYFDNGDTRSTEVRDTITGIYNYYVDNSFNRGVGAEDNMTYCHAIVIDGITYNFPKHQYVTDEQHAYNLDMIAAASRRRLCTRLRDSRPLIGDYICALAFIPPSGGVWIETMVVASMSRLTTAFHPSFGRGVD
jgi:hypothetical protein